jgi:phosphoribosyl-ATP pyrophosphohydrolase/phosphoribosyl-AMP cyclohydrolase
VDNTLEIKWNDQGLIPAIVQDEASGEVLMMAWMNADALHLTQIKGQTYFWSRSRNALWHKGEISGNTQDVVSLWLDCDGDTLLVRVRPHGPACHTGEVSCFFQALSDKKDKD